MGPSNVDIPDTAVMTRRRRARPVHLMVLCLPMLLTLSGCGGGGSSSPPPPQAPDAQFSVTTDNGFAPLAVSFDASASRDPDGSIASYAWSFGDSSSASGVRVSHTFTDPGSFSVSLKVTDTDGLTGSASHLIQVHGTTISGVVQIAPSTGVDSDVNDRFTTPVSNNTFAAAQPVGDPLLLGGFVNLPGTGSSTGNFHDTGDPEDIFGVDLNGGERIVLSIGDPASDLDLELYSSDTPPQLLDSSVSPDPQHDPTEDLQAPAQPGRYFVRVVAVSGASNYVLNISRDAGVTMLARRAKRLTDPFVPGDVLVAATPRGTVHRLRLRPAGGRGNRVTLPRSSGTPGADVLVPAVHLAAGAAMSRATAARYRTLLAARYLHVARHQAISEVNVLRRPARLPDDPHYPQQWNLRDINLPQAWDITTGQASPPVVIAVVDTGVLLDHPDLKNKLLRDAGGHVIGYDFVADPQRANDGDGIDPDPSDPGDDGDGPGMGSFHGTHVAGIAAADTNNGIGVAGVSWNARIMPVRALGINGGTTFDVMQAVRYAARLSNVSGTVPPLRADVINMSLGSDFYSEAEQQTINDVRAQGVFVVASAGNSGNSVPSYPASYDGVISVAATTVNDQSSSYSNFGPFIDVAAPGGDVAADGSLPDANHDGIPDGILSTLGSGGGNQIQLGYGYLVGTSMAAPHVAGVIALMKAVYPPLTPAEFDGLLSQGRLTRDAGAAGRDDHYGYGIIDAYQAVVAAESISGAEVGPIVSASVGTLDFQKFTQALDFSVNNLGDAETSVTVSDDADWLTVMPVAVAADGFGQYRATIDRSGLADGPYTATITVSSRDASVSGAAIQVLMQVVSPDATADAGQQYVVLTTPDRSDSIALDAVTASNGEYHFTLQDVAPGDYRLFSGTDLNDDDTICDGGEACGAYPNLSAPAIIHVAPAEQANLQALTFASEFRSIVTTNRAAADAAADGGAAAGAAKGIKLNKELPR